MPLRVDRRQAIEKDRLALVSLAHFSLGLMHNWKNRLPDLETTAVVMAVLAIRAERLTRSDPDQVLLSLKDQTPQHILARCNVASVAAATGLNRETARRKVKWLIEEGVLHREDNGSLAFVPGILQLPETAELAHRQLALLVRTTNKLIDAGILKHRKAITDEDR
jgi:hypothetical protein